MTSAEMIKRFLTVKSDLEKFGFYIVQTESFHIKHKNFEMHYSCDTIAELEAFITGYKINRGD